MCALHCHVGKSSQTLDFFFTFSFWVLILVICDLCQPLLVTSRDYNTTKSIAPLTHPHILQCVLLLTQVLIYLLIVRYMNCQKIVKTKKKQDHQNIKKPHVMSLNIFFWLSRTPKTLNILSSNTKKSRKSSHFCLKNDFNNELTNCFRSKSLFLFVFVVILCKEKLGFAAINQYLGFIYNVIFEKWRTKHP